MQNYYNNNNSVMYTKNQVAIMNYFRVLWEQHNMWTKETITSLVFNLPTQDATVTRLLRNPKDFENILKDYYGVNSAAQFGELLTEHLIIAADIVKAAMVGDRKELDKATKLWYENADSIANLLSNMNPYWKEQEWKNMLYRHLNLVYKEATEMLTGKYGDSVNTFDEIQVQGLNMADVMSHGIINQFQIK